MKISDIPPDTLERIKKLRYDRIIEKHEGPWDWEGRFRFGDPEVMSVAGYNVLLPLDREQHANITILRTVVSDDAQVITIFLKDTTYWGDDLFAGFIAICERLSDIPLYVATIYHEWFIIEQSVSL